MHPSDNHQTIPFDRSVIEHQSRIYGFIRAMVYNPEDARDILQDVNIILLKKRASFETGTNFKAWAFTIARFECLAYLSRHKKFQPSTLDTGLIDSLAEIVEQESETIEPRIYALRLCLKLLSIEFRELLEFRYSDKIPLEKVAEQKNVTVTSVKQKLYRIRNNLKKCIDNRLEEEKSHQL